MSGNGHDHENVHVTPGVALVEVDDIESLNKRLDDLFNALNRNKEVQLKLHRTVRFTILLVTVYFVFVFAVLMVDFHTNLWHH